MMGEIKSTLDLIMEKTKNLSLGPEEKKEIRRQEWLKKARGLIQKFLGKRIDLEKVKDELLGREIPSGGERILKRELIEGLEPGSDNEERLQLVKGLLNLPLNPYLKILESFNQKAHQEKLTRLNQMKRNWAAQGFSGPAIVPNLNSDPGWGLYLEQEKQTCKEKLAKEI
jgi:hypothetical protein